MPRNILVCDTRASEPRMFLCRTMGGHVDICPKDLGDVDPELVQRAASGGGILGLPARAAARPPDGSVRIPWEITN